MDLILNGSSFVINNLMNMKKKPISSGKKWTKNNISSLKKLIQENTPTELIAYRLGRSKNAIKSFTSKNNLSLMPINKSPYNRRNKRS